MATKDFIDYSPTSGSNNGLINVTAAKNPQLKPRYSAISVAGEG